MIVKPPEAELNLFRQMKSAAYTLLDNQKHESTSLPVNPNTLNYLDKTVEVEYLKELYLDKSDLIFSEEFRRMLIYYYTFSTLLISTLFGFTLMLYTSSNLSAAQFSIQFSLLFVFFLSNFVILYSIYKKPALLLTNRSIFTAFAIFFNSFLIFCDNRILSVLLSQDYSSNSIPYSLALVSFCFFCRNVLFDDFFHYCLISIHTIVCFLVAQMSISHTDFYPKLCECAVIVLVLCFLLIDCHINTLRSKILFWRKYNEEAAVFSSMKTDRNIKKEFTTETEQLIYILEKVKCDIKFVAKAIIFKDIKQKLKNALVDIYDIKKIVGHRSARDSKIMIEHHVEDLEDREFIHQNYQDVSSNTGTRRVTTVVTFLDQSSSVPMHEYGLEELAGVMESIGKNWSFDIWFVHETTGKSVSILARYLFSKFDFLTRYNIPPSTLETYFLGIESRYNDNPYHNACHGADVLHTLMYFYFNSEIQKFLNPVETMSSVVAALAHDVGHPGVTSRYLIMNRDPLSLQFNDISVLENMHCATIFQLMAKPGHNIFESLDSEDWAISRKVVIEMVLATDMAKHFEILGMFRTRASILSDINLDKFEDKILVFSTALKAADIGHSAKYTDLHQKWSKLVMEEFFKQGDLEKIKNLPVSMYCDRKNTNISKSQAGFLKNICLPMYEVWVRFLDSEPVERTLKQLKKNIEFWEITQKSRRSTQPVGSDNIISLNFVGGGSFD